MSPNFPDLSLPPILLVDDCEDDIFLLRHRLRAGGICNPIQACTSAAAALEYLDLLPANAARPGLLFTDIRMGETDGFEFVGVLRSQPRWDDLKIVVVTCSSNPADLERALDLRVSGYLIKFPPPDILAEFVQHGPWLEVARRTTTFAHVLSA
jgi:CheY-like chemotaxis protein